MKLSEVNNDMQEAKLGDPLPKNIFLSDAARETTGGVILSEDFYQYDRGNVASFLGGAIDTVRDLGNYGSRLKVFGGQGLMKLGDMVGSKKTVTIGQSMIQTAQRNIDMVAQEISRYSSSKETESFAYALGGGAVNYGLMFATGGTTGAVAKGMGMSAKAASKVAASAVFSEMFGMEAGSEAQERIEKYKKDTGDTELKDYTPDMAGKNFASSAIYATGSAIIEKWAFKSQKIIFKSPKTIALTGLKASASEGGTEAMQSLLNTGIDLADGTIDFNQLPDRLKGTLMETAVGSVLGFTAGVGVGYANRNNAIKQVKEVLKETVPPQDLDNVAKTIVDDSVESLQGVIATELTLSSELKAKHGEIYDSMLNAVHQAINESGAMQNVSEADLAQYESDTAKLFADQVLAEANKRNSLIDDVIRVSEIAYQDGKIMLRNKEDGKSAVQLELFDTPSVQENEIKASKLDVTMQSEPKLMRNEARKYLKDVIKKQDIAHPELGKIRVSNKGINEFINATGNLDKIALIPHLKELIETSTVGEKENLTHPRTDGIVAFYPLYNEATIDRKKYKVTTKIGVDENGNLFYTLLLDEPKENLSSNKPTKGKPAQAQTDNSAHGDSITQTDENVNDFDGELNLEVSPIAEPSIKGSFSTSQKAIQITKDADFSTLPHELSHFWLDNMWEYVRSGNASEAYKEQFNSVAKWLGMREGQTYITRRQHEKFARGYEAYLLNGELPEPMIKGAFDDYDRWLKKVYTDANKIGVKLNADAVRFFQSMTTGKLPELTTIPLPAVNEEIRASQEADIQNHVKTAEKILNPTPIAPTTSTITTGETGKSAVYTREIEENRRLDQMQAELPELEYNKVKLKDQLQKATDYVVSNLAEARDVVYGRRAAPEGLLDTSIRIAYEEAMLSQGNTGEYLRALKLHSSAQTIRGQEISAERIARDDISSPKYWFDKLSYNRRSQVANKLKSRLDITGSEESAVAKLNKLIADKSKELSKLVLKTKDPVEQRRIMQDFAAKLKKEYKLDSQPEELYQEVITADNAAIETMAFIEQTFGVSVAEDEMSSIVAKLENIEKSAEKTEDKTGNPSIETLAMYDRLNKEVEAKTPSNPLAIATSIVGRAVMLSSVKSPVLNIISNAETLTIEGLANRIAAKTEGKSIENLVDKEARNDYLRYAVEAYNASGFNISTTENRNFETKIRGEKILTTQGEGKFRKLAQYLETGVFKYSMGFPDSVSKDLAFVDFVSLEASNLGKTKEKATEIFNDAILIEPKTAEGKEIRKKAIAYAHKATFTNDSLASKVSLKVRDVLNTTSGNLRLGDQIMPFVKTPANVVSIGAEYSMGVLYAGLHINEIINDIKSGNLSETSRNAITYATRNGLGVLLAALLAACFEPEDYIPEYALLSPSEKALMQDKNAVYNSVKIGDKYVSLDYFGPLGAVMSGILSAKRSMAKEDSYSKAAGSFMQGTGTALLFNMPAFEAGKEAWDSAADFLKQDSEKNLADLKAMTANYVMARTIPSIVSDLAKMLDKYERDTNRSVVNVFKSKIPFLRQDLAPKYSKLSGQPIETENELFTLLFGSRVKSGTQSLVNDEITRLYNNNVKVSLSDPSKSGKLGQLDDRLKPDIRQKFAKGFFDEVADLMKTGKYQRSDDETKADLINKVRKKVTDKIKKSYGIK